MCNLYAMMKQRAEVTRAIRAMTDRNNNQPPQPGIYPDYEAPVVVVGADGQREMRNLRWGMPSSKKALLEAANKRLGTRICVSEASVEAIGAASGFHFRPIAGVPGSFAS